MPLPINTSRASKLSSGSVKPSKTITDALSAESRGDLATVWRLLRPFANQDDTRASHYLEELKAKMTPAQIADAEKQAGIEDALAAMKQGRKEDYASALQLLRPLAEQGDARAEYYLGKLYYRQDGLESGLHRFGSPGPSTSRRSSVAPSF